MSPPERAAGKGSSARHNPLKRNQDKEGSRGQLGKGAFLFHFHIFISFFKISVSLIQVVEGTNG